MEFSPPKSPIFLPKLNCKNFNFGFYFWDNSKTLHVNFRVIHMYNPGIWVSFNSHSHACSPKLPRNTFISGLCNRLELDFLKSMTHNLWHWHTIHSPVVGDRENLQVGKFHVQMFELSNFILDFQIYPFHFRRFKITLMMIHSYLDSVICTTI